MCHPLLPPHPPILLDSRASHTKILYTLIFFTMRVTCRANLIHLDFTILITLVEGYKPLTSSHAVLPAYHFIPSLSKYSPRRPVLRPLQSMFLPSYVSYTYKTTGNTKQYN
jgi:hypothetical protein